MYILVLLLFLFLETPLTTMVQLPNSSEACSMLMSYGAHLDYRAANGMTVMHKAVLSCRDENITVSFLAYLLFFLFKYVLLGKGPKAYSKAPNKGRKRKVKLRKRDKIRFFDVRFENRQVVRLV